MQRYTPGQYPPGSAERPREQVREGAVPPLSAACALGELVRMEHGNIGVRRYLSAILPFVPLELVQQASGKLGVAMPSLKEDGEKAPPHQPQHQTPQRDIPIDQLVKLLSANSGGKGIDPAMLLQMLGK